MRVAPLAVIGDGGVLRFANDAWRVLFDDGDHRVFEPHVEKAIDGRVTIQLGELALRDRTCAVAIYPMDGCAIVSIATEALQHRFVELMSHELRSPIATIGLWADVLRTAPTEEIRTRAVDAIANSCAFQNRLVADLLDLARGIAGKLLIEQRPVEIEPALLEVVDGAAHAAKGVALDVAIDRGLGVVQGDEVRIRQVLGALLTTAIERTAPNERVTVSARPTNDRVEIRVRYAGPRPTPEQLATMFEPFGEHYAGSAGVRLSLAHQLVRLHDGSLIVSAEGDRGVTFALTLPQMAR